MYYLHFEIEIDLYFGFITFKLSGRKLLEIEATHHLTETSSSRLETERPLVHARRYFEELQDEVPYHQHQDGIM